MNRHTLRYYFTEGFRGIFLHAFSSFAAVGVITACLLIMGSFSLVAVNIQAMVTEMEQSSEIVVEIDESLSDAAARSVGTQINRIENVYEAEWFPREDAFAQYVEKLEDPLLMQSFTPDIFPHRYKVYLVNVQYAEETARDLEALPGVAAVNVERDLLNSLLSIRRVVRVVSVVFILALLVVSLFIMQNTIKLATFERREEIAIMRVVGAAKGFIRWPFVVEGFLLGLMAGLLAYFLQALAYNRFADSLLRPITPIQLISFGELWLPVLAVFLLTGFLVGVFGSVLTIRKYLRA
ncbi:MAG: permease-like cell division protein FtsX [Oscillospiraceae bacterium]|jgi:cell division transport system permease protein|nr:permease-like cell division protein FtsX [Oscillospiraceae bacterium]